MPLKTSGRVNYPKDYSLSRSIGEVFDNTNEVSDLNLTNELNNIHSENFRVYEESASFGNFPGEHFVELTIPSRFLIKRLIGRGTYNGDFAVEFASGSDEILINGVVVQEMGGQDGVDVEVEDIVESITKDEMIIKVKADGIDPSADSTMYAKVTGYQL